MRSKSQTSTEYIILVAVVIIIALIVVGILGGIPGISTGSSDNVARAKLSSQPVGVQEYAVTNQETTLKLKNNLQDNIRIDSIQLDGTTCTLSEGTPTISFGKFKTVTCTNVANSDAGNTFEYDLQITYTNLKTNAQFDQQDNDVKLVGTVANSVGGSGGSSTWCFQETATVANGCGALGTGAYVAPSGANNWINLTFLYDGDYNTFATKNTSVGIVTYLDINYSKPTNATSSSLWQVKGGENNLTFNTSIPSSCWSQSPLQFRIGIVWFTSQNMYGYCHNGTSFQQLMNLEWDPIISNPPIFEEAVWWSMS